jgi:FkbM family methyltransferase
MRYGKARNFEWSVGNESTFLLKSDFEDDYFELSYTKTFGAYEPETLAAWEEITKDKKFVLDVGAYTGVFSLIASRDGGAHRCMAFEPNPVSYGKLVENVNINNAADRVQTINKGVGENAGSISLVVPALRTGSSAVQFITSKINRNTEEWKEIGSIQIDTIDSALSEERNPVDAMKIDVEGYELNVLKGATECLKRDKPIILLECLSFFELEQISNFLRPFGYSCTKSLDGEPMTERLNESINNLTRARNYIFRHN